MRPKMTTPTNINARNKTIVATVFCPPFLSLFFFLEFNVLLQFINYLSISINYLSIFTCARSANEHAQIAVSHEYHKLVVSSLIQITEVSGN